MKRLILTFLLVASFAYGEGALLSAAHRRNAGGFPGPVPTIAGCKLWLAADHITGGLVDGDPISTWQDASGNGHDATQSGGARPTYKTTIVNGNPAALFVSASTQFMSGSITLSQPMTIFVVVKHVTLASTYQFYLDGSTNRVAVLRIDTATPGYESYAGADAGISVSPDANWHYITTVINGSSTIFVLDGSATTGLAAGSNSLGPLYYLGASNPVISGQAPMDGYYAELIIYDTALSSGDRTTIQNYLKTKYGL